MVSVGFPWLDGMCVRRTEEMADIMAAVNASWRPDLAHMDSDHLRAYLTKNGHCSVLIKVRRGGRNIHVLAGDGSLAPLVVSGEQGSNYCHLPCMSV